VNAEGCGRTAFVERRAMERGAERARFRMANIVCMCRWELSRISQWQEEEERRAGEGSEEFGWMWTMCNDAAPKSKSQNAQTLCISSTRAGGGNATLCADHIILFTLLRRYRLGPIHNSGVVTVCAQDHIHRIPNSSFTYCNTRSEAFGALKLAHTSHYTSAPCN
jgi:hypothetical protein